jgi:hypothetical protein
VTDAWTVVQRLKGEVVARTKFATQTDAEVHAQGLLRDIGGLMIYIESPVAPFAYRAAETDSA